MRGNSAPGTAFAGGTAAEQQTPVRAIRKTGAVTGIIHPYGNKEAHIFKGLSDVKIRKLLRNQTALGNSEGQEDCGIIILASVTPTEIPAHKRTLQEQHCRKPQVGA